MRWIPFFILAYVIVGLQLGVGDYISYRGAAPNLILLAVVFVAVNAPRDAALLGAFFMGLLQDLVSSHPLGLCALAYGLVAMGIVGAQHTVYKEHPLAHFVLVLIGGFIVAGVLGIHGWLRPPTPRLVQDARTLPAIRGSIAGPFISALYTALLAPGFLWVLGRFRKMFRFQSGRRRAW